MKETMIFRHVVILVGSLIVSLSFNHTQAGVSVIGFKADSKHKTSIPWDGQFFSLDGNYFDVSNFYASRKLEFSASGTAVIEFTKTIDFLVPFAVDAGYDSSLYQTTPSLSAGFGLVYSNENYAFALSAGNLVSIGGKVSERACTDEFNRKFHCGLGIAWTDYTTIQPKIEENYRLAFSMRF